MKHAEQYRLQDKLYQAMLLHGCCDAVCVFKKEPICFPTAACACMSSAMLELVVAAGSFVFHLACCTLLCHSL